MLTFSFTAHKYQWSGADFDTNLKLLLQ